MIGQDSEQTPAAGRWASQKQRSARRDHILDTALQLLAQHGYEGTSMQKVAQVARTSKETLYAWFGDKAGLFEALVEREAQAMNDDLVAALGDARGDTREVLEVFGVNVLSLLLGRRSLAINRAAIAAAPSNPELGRILAGKGRENTRPLVERFLAGQHASGNLQISDTAEAFELLMGLLVRDLQIRLLFAAAPPPDAAAIRRRAASAVDAFLRLHAS